MQVNKAEYFIIFGNYCLFQLLKHFEYLLAVSKLPAASSQITNGWQTTAPSSRSLCKSGSCFRRCSIQTEVSTRIMPRNGGEESA